MRKYIDNAWKDLTTIGLSKGASRDRLTFTTDLKEALSKADFVQENGPERPDFKIKLFADMSDATPWIRSSPRDFRWGYDEAVIYGHQAIREEAPFGIVIRNGAKS